MSIHVRTVPGKALRYAYLPTSLNCANTIYSGIVTAVGLWKFGKVKRTHPCCRSNCVEKVSQ